MTQKITDKMLKARLQWISDLIKLPLEVDDNEYGVTLYIVDKKDKGSSRRMQQIAYTDSTREMFQVLQGMYDILSIILVQK
jgi:hypothetical protein